MKMATKTEKRNLNNVSIFMLLLLIIAMTSIAISSCEYLAKNLTHSSFFVLKGISIYGNSNIRSADISKFVGLDVGKDPLYSFMSHIVAKRIKFQSRYIKEVKVKRNLIKGELAITVEERKPEAIITKSTEAKYFKIVDISGFIIDEITDKDIVSSSFKNMPFIVDNDVNNQELFDNDYVISKSASLGLKVLAETKSVMPDLLDKISHIDARNPDDIILNLHEKIDIRIASDRIREGLSDARCLILSSELRYLDKNINYIDARFPDAVYCG